MEEKNRCNVTGMKFPPQVNPATGRFETVSDEESIKESIRIILMTGKKERFVRPEFGSNILSFPFMNQNRAIMNLKLADLERDIRRNEPRVKSVKVSVDHADDEKLYINVDYTIYGNEEDKNLKVVL